MSLVDNFTYFFAYGLLVLFTFSFVSSVFVGGLAALGQWTFARMPSERRPRLATKAKAAVVFLSLASGCIVVFLSHTMFFQFSSFHVSSSNIQLDYFWPRSAASFSRNEFKNLEFETDQKGTSQLILSAEKKRYVSVPFDKTVSTNEIQQQFIAWLAQTNR